MAVSANTSGPEPKSSHVADATTQSFLQPDFDPADYLNSSLPQLSTRNTSGGRTVPLSELSTQLQTLLSRLNAQTSRLSTALTQATDEIIRSGGRLAYEVEVLRGEATGLTDLMDNGLKKDIEVFATADARNFNGEERQEGEAKAGNTAGQPEYLERLQTLSSVRERLDQVIKVFGDAMAWPLAPSEMSVASSFISVSAPGNEDDNRSREQRGKEYMEKVRREINDHLGSGESARAQENVDGMRQLAEVWKGTAEEKARHKLVDGLQKLVDDKQKTLQPGKSTASGRKPTPSPSRTGGDLRYGDREGGYGFLKKLDVYLDS